MRSHQQIVRDHGASELYRALRGEGFVLNGTTPQRWADRDSIPGEYWAALEKLNVASLSELAQARETAARRTDEAA